MVSYETHRRDRYIPGHGSENFQTYLTETIQRVGTHGCTQEDLSMRPPHNWVSSKSPCKQNARGFVNDFTWEVNTQVKSIEIYVKDSAFRLPGLRFSLYDASNQEVWRYENMSTGTLTADGGSTLVMNVQ